MIDGLWRTTLADGETIAFQFDVLPGGNGVELGGRLGNKLRKNLLVDLWAARLAEPLGSNLLSGQRLQLVVQRERAGEELALELAPDLAWPLIMADRCARGLQPVPAQAVYLYGNSPDWLAGEIVALPDSALRTGQMAADAQIWCGAGGEESNQVDQASSRVRTVGHLSELQGHPRGASLWRRAAVWFPVVGSQTDGVAQQDALLELRVMVRPRQYGASDEDDEIQVVGRELTMQQAKQCRLLLQQTRNHDRHGRREWLTVVHFPNRAITGSSWQFALAVADRIARGRDFCGSGKTVASGRILPEGNEPFGNVFEVGDIAQKCALIVRQAERHMRVLLPAACREAVPQQFREDLATRGAGCALIQRV